jgi:hypothetical protein
VLRAALFALVIAAFLFGMVAWVIGVINALAGRMVPLPGIGQRVFGAASCHLSSIS